MEVSGQLHASAALPPGKRTPVPLGRRLGGPQNRSEHCVKTQFCHLLVEVLNYVCNLCYPYVYIRIDTHTQFYPRYPEPKTDSIP
jgi:hypothetical protein